MDLEQALDFLRANRNGVLVTIKHDGRPQTSNIIHVVEDNGRIAISVTDGRAKTRNVRRDPRVSLHVSAPDFWSYAVVEGTAELTPPAADPDDDTVDQLVAHYRRIAGEHPDWDEYRRAMVDDRRLVLRVRPERAYGMA